MDKELKQRKALYVFHFVVFSLITYYSFFHHILIIAGIIAGIFSFFYLLSLITYILGDTNDLAELNMMSSVLNSILTLAFFFMAFFASHAGYPKALLIVPLVLGTIFALNFIGITNKSYRGR